MQLRRTQGISLGVAIALTLAMAPAAIGASHEGDAAGELGGSMHVCQFISGDGDNVTQLIVDLDCVFHANRSPSPGFSFTPVGGR